ncbi:NAD(P)-binding protein [Neolentinus lepideus HHB14362 ss-1]|uniref:NAD(P)-binding protein n=1 Tax=Neolentinus lepideus HHB14362 ss-1 TaxID=1314782 RepID=A0A165SQF8_9AGAM|nr:NAD(P)-binding protein [Neolentinus lepideus HHB14362 ss-1]
MPAVIPPSKVLVTGANGYIAIWVVRRLLEKGYSVRGIVRSESKAEHLRQLFNEYGGKHEVVVVEDITKEGTFDEAVKDIDAIEHTASPFHLLADDPNEFIEPAVKGTLGVLQSALKYGRVSLGLWYLHGRFIVSGGTFKWQDFVDAAHKAGVYPESALPKGVPGSGYAPGVTHLIDYDASKAARVLGMDKYISKEQCVKDCLEDFKERGW